MKEALPSALCPVLEEGCQSLQLSEEEGIQKDFPEERRYSLGLGKRGEGMGILYRINAWVMT